MYQDTGDYKITNPNCGTVVSTNTCLCLLWHQLVGQSYFSSHFSRVAQTPNTWLQAGDWCWCAVQITKLSFSTALFYLSFPITVKEVAEKFSQYPINRCGLSDITIIFVGYQLLSARLIFMLPCFSQVNWIWVSFSCYSLQVVLNTSLGIVLNYKKCIYYLMNVIYILYNFVVLKC